MLDRLQAEHKAWVDEMYPQQDSWYPALCLVEEVGELVKPVLKSMQQNEWGPEPRYAHKDWTPELVDAIGDVAIASCSVCNAADVLWVPGYGSESKNVRHMLIKIVNLASVVLASRVGVGANVTELTAELRVLATCVGVDFEPAVLETWANVKLRSRRVSAQG